MIESDAYIQWTKLFNDKILCSYNNEKQELQNAAMLLTALRTEFENVSHILQQQFERIKNQLKQKAELESQITSPSKRGLSISKSVQKIETNLESKVENTLVVSDLDSPDIFRNNSLKHGSSNHSTIDISESDADNTYLEDSPTLVSKRKKSKVMKDQAALIKRNMSRCVDKENFFIDCTPEIKSPKKNSKKRGKVKKSQKSTITRLFCDISKDETLCDVRKPDEDLVNTDKTFQEWMKDDDAIEMGITRLLSYINKDDTQKSTKSNSDQNEDEMDSTQEVDEFSKAILLDESLGIKSSPIKRVKMSPCAEPVVRGHARQLLKGFSCAQCREFYAGMRLSPEELQKRMDECSKHRYKYQPPEDTYPGIWDMTIPDEKINNT